MIENRIEQITGLEVCFDQVNHVFLIEKQLLNAIAADMTVLNCSPGQQRKMDTERRNTATQRLSQNINKRSSAVGFLRWLPWVAKSETVEREREFNR